jgi:hypothetical protein
MKRPLYTLFFLFALASILGAQTVHDPNSDLYKDIDRWFVQGYITEFLPLIRPYPLPLVDRILDDVIENGSAAEQERAAKYREILAPGSRFLHPGIFGTVEGKNGDYGIIGAPFVEGAARVTDFLSASYFLGIYGFTDETGGELNVPGTYSPYPDIIDDTANVGAVELRPGWTSLMAVGKSDMYFQAGLARSSVGPFYDNGPVVGPQAPKAGHFSFVVWRPLWSYEILFQSITATDDYGNGKFADKYNIVHMLSFRPIPKLELGFVQAIVWGERIEPLYLVPFSFLFASQSMNGFGDNALMGLHLNWRPVDNLLFKGQVYADDISFNGLFSGDYKFKMAAEAGVSWTPKRGFLSKLDFDYTAVLPYMYTHWNQSDAHRYNGKFTDKEQYPNYLNYTHLGRNLGPDLEPNSDRISVRSYWNPLTHVDLNVSAYFIRHGNASEGLDGLNDPVAHDGSVFDDGSTDFLSPDHNPHNNMFFLTQAVLDLRLGGSLGLCWTIPSKIGVFKLMGEYGMEYGWNRGLEADDDGIDHYWSIGGMWSW